jgi:WXG100 family type VII secretion target
MTYATSGAGDSRTKVNFGALDHGAAQITSTLKNLQDSLHNLESGLTPMVSTWTGDAREAYYQQKKKWDDASAAMATILGQMISGVQTTNENYHAGESTNISRWS